MSNLRVRMALIALVGAVCMAGLVRAGADGEFTKLFNGKNLEGWKRVLADPNADPDKVWSVHEGIIICAGAPNGYIMTEKAYKNYVLKLQWRYANSGDKDNPFKLGDQKKNSGNSGVLVHSQPPFKVWPKSVEVQLHNATAGSIFPIGGAKSDKRTSVKNKAKPVGEWNSYEITAKDGKLSVILNGEKVGEVSGCNPSSGHISLQSEGAEIHFRKGQVDEWRKVLTNAQKRKAAELIPRSLAKRMKWLAVG